MTMSSGLTTGVPAGQAAEPVGSSVIFRPGRWIDCWHPEGPAQWQSRGAAFAPRLVDLVVERFLCAERALAADGCTISS